MCKVLMDFDRFVIVKLVTAKTSRINQIDLNMAKSLRCSFSSFTVHRVSLLSMNCLFQRGMLFTAPSFTWC